MIIENLSLLKYKTVNCTDPHNHNKLVQEGIECLFDEGICFSSK